MKKLLSLSLTLALLLSMLVSCDIPEQVTSGSGADEVTTAPDIVDATPGGDGTTSREDESTAKPEENTSTTTTENGGNTTTPDPDPYTYFDFTPSEKSMFTELLGEVIPFAPTDEYYVDAYSYEGESGINFYTFGNVKADFDAYRQLFSAYTFVESYEDGSNNTWYTYQKGDYYVDLAFYETDDGNCIDVYAYLLTSSGGEGGETGETYTDFTSEEKDKFIALFGEVIPFVPNTEYYVEEYSLEGESGINFYTFGNTVADFTAYRQLFSDYTFVESYQDEYNDTWYTYQKGDYYVDLAFYETDSGNCIDVYAYVQESTGGENGGTGDGETENVDLITNNGKGLPQGTNGVYDVDLTDATYVKNVTDQGYYLDGCPTTGSPAVLVIPVDFSDYTAADRGYSTSVIEKAFLPDQVTTYYSVYDYYKLSSYGQLTLDITVLDFWFRPENPSTYYESATIDYFGETVDAGDQMVIDEALAYLATVMDLSEFDSDGNGCIDSIVVINTLDISEDNFHWAYRYWNIYTDENDEYFVYDGVSANDYLWASYQFIHESYDAEGNVSYDDTNIVNPYTYIHEMGHILGADDYYDTAGVGSPMGGMDIMDSMTGDHNAFTKFNLGWLTTSRLVTTDTSVTLTLKDFYKNGDTILLANNWDPTLGAYQEYYILAYYKSVELNAGEGGYFAREGVVVYHVNATLYKEEIEGEVYYDIYYNNTDVSDEYGTEHDLIEYVKSNEDTYTYIAGNSLPATTDDSGAPLQYTFTVDALTDDTATITFTKLA